MSNYTNGEVCDLRPSELLGIRTDLVAEYCDPNGAFTAYVSLGQTRTHALWCIRH